MSEIHESLKEKIKPLKLTLKEPVQIEMDGHIILIDRRYLPIFCNFAWYVEKGKGNTNYLRANVEYEGKKRTIFIHQLIMGKHEGLEIDHINRNGLDNRECNLRIVTHQINQNNRSKEKTATSKYYGVSYDNNRKCWQVGFSSMGKRKNIGRFKTEIEAAVAYNNFLIKNNIKKELNHV